MSRARIGLGVLGAFVVAAGCGGTVNDQRSPKEQLRTDGAARCHTACQTVVSCGLDGDCACACGCRDGATDCQCPACECTKTSLATCESDCGETVTRVLDNTVPCDEEFVAILDCLTSATCAANTKDTCRIEERAFKECGNEDHSSPPPAATDLPGPAPTGDVLSVSCEDQGASGTATTPGSSLPLGEVFCETEWRSCSDGRSYDIQCKVGAGSILDCACLVDGLSQSAFIATNCPQDTTFADGLCGWHLQ